MPGQTAATTCIGLLRAINVGGRSQIAMADLRELADGLGMQDVRTLLQSGNLVFRSSIRTAGRLERMLEEAIDGTLRVRTEVFIRTAADWKAIVAANPFPEDAKRDPGHVVMMALRDVPASGDVAALQRAVVGRETARAHGKQLYIHYPDGIGRSRLTNLVIEKTLGTRGTARNWKTVLKLAELAATY
jgi:uncharacterized protein (DUF1697 family)